LIRWAMVAGLGVVGPFSIMMPNSSPSSRATIADSSATTDERRFATTCSSLSPTCLPGPLFTVANPSRLMWKIVISSAACLPASDSSTLLMNRCRFDNPVNASWVAWNRNRSSSRCLSEMSSTVVT
jgi:hypothetical protein